MSETERVTMFGPDFPFAFDDWISHPAGLGDIPAERHGARVAVIGAGVSGILCGYELMRLGVQPILYESAHLGGRVRSQPFEGAEPDVIAELGGMRFPVSSTGFYHYVDKLGLESCAFPNPLTPAAGSTVIDLWGETHYAETLDDLPPLFHEVARAYDKALEDGARFSDLKAAIRARDPARIKQVWNRSYATGTSAPSTTLWHRPRRSSRSRSSTARCSVRSDSARAAGTPTSRTRCWRSCA